MALENGVKFLENAKRRIHDLRSGAPYRFTIEYLFERQQVNYAQMPLAESFRQELSAFLFKSTKLIKKICWFLQSCRNL